MAFDPNFAVSTSIFFADARTGTKKSRALNQDTGKRFRGGFYDPAQ